MTAKAKSRRPTPKLRGRPPAPSKSEQKRKLAAQARTRRLIEKKRFAHAAREQREALMSRTEVPFARAPIIPHPPHDPKAAEVRAREAARAEARAREIAIHKDLDRQKRIVVLAQWLCRQEGFVNPFDRGEVVHVNETAMGKAGSIHFMPRPHAEPIWTCWIKLAEHAINTIESQMRQHP